MVRCVREGAILVLVVHIASQANLAEITGGASEAVFPANLASPKLVARVVLLGHCRLRHKRFAHTAQPLCSDQNEYPEAESVSLSLLGRLFGRWLFVFCLLEARRLAHMRMIEDVTKPSVGRKVSTTSAGIGCEVFLRSHGAICFAKADHLAISIGYVECRWIYPASLAVAPVCSEAPGSTVSASWPFSSRSE